MIGCFRRDNSCVVAWSHSAGVVRAQRTVLYCRLSGGSKTIKERPAKKSRAKQRGRGDPQTIAPSLGWYTSGGLLVIDGAASQLAIPVFSVLHFNLRD